ncbi:MAG TPA: hypothetical protein PKD52_09860 [Clostridiales bacterium]|nr:hypothetical protein [Clostridiales bacterium]
MVEPLSVLCCENIVIFVMMLYGAIYTGLWLIMIAAYTIIMVLNLWERFSVKAPGTKPRILLKDIKNHSLKTMDVRITGIMYQETFRSLEIPTFANLLYKEPFLRLGVFNIRPVISTSETLNAKVGVQQNEDSLFDLKPFYFFLEKPSLWCYLLPKYKWYRRDWKNWLAEEAIAGDMYKRNFDYDIDAYYIYFITLEKREAFNELFRLLVPTEIRIVTYEKSRVFKELHPIPGKEYPPEALECMRKINAMYP